MTDSQEKTAPVEVTETEEELISTAQQAMSHCNWVVGECAAKWTQRYAKGRTDADFSEKVGLSPDQIYQRRRVWETFGDVRESYSSLKWSHYYVALNWDDAPECLQWAEENQAKVKEMKAWRRALKGEDLTTEALPDPWSGDPSISYVPTEMKEVREPGDPPPFDADGQPVTAGQSRGVETVGAAARETEGEDVPYAPFKQGATQVPSKGENLDATPPPVSSVPPEQALKKMLTMLEKVNKELTPERVKALEDLPEKVRNRFLKTVSELSSKVAGLL